MDVLDVGVGNAGAWKKVNNAIPLVNAAMVCRVTMGIARCARSAVKYAVMMMIVAAKAVKDVTKVAPRNAVK